MLHRHFSSFLIGFYSLFSLACLSWSADPAVRTLKHAYFYLMSPTSVPLTAEIDTWGSFGGHVMRLLRLDQSYKELNERWQGHRLDEKRLEALERENERLTQLLQLPPLPRYTPLASRVLTRDPNDWFHGFLIHRGKADGVEISDPVVTLQEGREVFVGQIVEVYDKTSRVLLVTDPLSAVSASIRRTQEQGAVEGQGGNLLAMNYLFSDSDVQLGDEVVTAGLGQIFPEGIWLGTVQSVVEASQENFKKAYLKPAVRLNQLQEVLVLRRERRRETAEGPVPSGAPRETKVP